MSKLVLGMMVGAGFLCCPHESKAQGGAPAAGGHVLAKPATAASSLPPGVKRTIETVAEVKNASVTVDTTGKSAQGTMSSKDSDVMTMEGISETRFRTVQEKVVQEGSIVFGDKVQPKPQEQPLLKGIPVIVEKKEDGRYSATFERGGPTAEQTTMLGTLATSFAAKDEFALYGDAPRKPGDKWNVDAKLAGGFVGPGDWTGTCKIEFVEVKDVGGIPCAVLKAVFDVKGSLPPRAGMPPTNLTYQGEAITQRSLADLLDLEVKVQARTTMVREQALTMRMRVSGNYTMLRKSSQAKP